LLLVLAVLAEQFNLEQTALILLFLALHQQAVAVAVQMQEHRA
jgi:hypothetical protein